MQKQVPSKEWAQRAKLGLAALIFGVNGTLGFVLLMAAGAMPNIFALMVRVCFVVLLERGAGAA